MSRRVSALPHHAARCSRFENSLDVGVLQLELDVHDVVCGVLLVLRVIVRLVTLPVATHARRYVVAGGS